MAEKSEKLEAEVWGLERCAGCGMCVTACSKGVLSFSETREHPIREVREKILGLSHTELDTCFFCEGTCVESCPRLAEWEVGEIVYVASARTTRSTKSGASNDVITDLLCSLMQNGFIDGAVVTDVDRWSLKPVSRVATSIKELVECMGNLYIWTPTLQSLHEAVHTLGLEKIAVVGTPCVAQAIRRVQGSTVEGLEAYRRALQLVVGVFCSAMFPYNVIPEVIVKDTGIPLHNIRRVDRSTKNNNFMVTLRDGSTRVIALEDVQGYVRKGCARCDDFLAEMSDISIGAVGAKNGYSTVIARNAKGMGCLLNAKDWGFLDIDEEVDMEALRAAREEKERRKRVQMFDSLSIVVLDALKDHSRIEEAKRRFGALYELKTREMPKQSSKGGCEGCSVC
ncbi:MAG: Coenzyme F420 hydrogenase/dehydrogenase, beta subunit C-terminal domain [Candidatus Geothermarchaeales archaeon]